MQVFKCCYVHFNSICPPPPAALLLTPPTFSFPTHPDLALATAVRVSLCRPKGPEQRLGGEQCGEHRRWEQTKEGSGAVEKEGRGEQRPLIYVIKTINHKCVIKKKKKKKSI